MLTGAVVLAGAGGVCAAAAIIEAAGSRPRVRRRGTPRPTRSAPARAAALLIGFGRRAGSLAAPERLEAQIAAAGAPLGLSAPDVMALKGASALTGLLSALALVTSLPGRLGIALVLCAPAGGFLAPDVLLSRRSRRRAERISRELADVLDLMRVAIQAGLPVGRALAEVGSRCSGVLAAELRAAAVRIELGVTRADALAELVLRSPVEAVSALVSAIARADLHGAPLAPALEALVVEARAEQGRRLRDDAARAAPKIQLVVALVLVPAVMLLVGAVLMRALVPPG